MCQQVNEIENDDIGMSNHVSDRSRQLMVLLSSSMLTMMVEFSEDNDMAPGVQMLTTDEKIRVLTHGVDRIIESLTHDSHEDEYQ